MQRPFPFDSISIECNAGTSWLTTQQSSWRSRAIRCLHLVIPSNYSIFASFVYFCLPQALWFVWYLYIFFPSSLLLSSSYSITTTFRLLVWMSIPSIQFQVAPTYSKLALPIGHYFIFHLCFVIMFLFTFLWCLGLGFVEIFLCPHFEWILSEKIGILFIVFCRSLI